MDEFPLERVAAITGCDPEGIAAAARLYATSAPGVIPWTPITDQQRNSTSAIRLHCALRVLTGSRDAPGGELMHGFHRDIVPESTLELHEALPAGQKAKQLGADTHPAFTYRGMETLGEPARRVWGHEYPNLVSGCYMANPTATFRAMATGEPYPVKAFFTLGNNTLMGFANMQCIRRRRLAHGEAAGRPRRRGGALPGARVSRRFGWGGRAARGGPRWLVCRIAPSPDREGLHLDLARPDSHGPRLGGDHLEGVVREGRFARLAAGPLPPQVLARASRPGGGLTRWRRRVPTARSPRTRPRLTPTPGRAPGRPHP